MSTELAILVSSFSSLFSLLEADLIICRLQEALDTLRALGKVCGFVASMNTFVRLDVTAAAWSSGRSVMQTDRS